MQQGNMTHDHTCDPQATGGAGGCLQVSRLSRLAPGLVLSNQLNSDTPEVCDVDQVRDLTAVIHLDIIFGNHRAPAAER